MDWHFEHNEDNPTKPANRQMAEKMKAAQAREIADFEKKMQRGV